MLGFRRKKPHRSGSHRPPSEAPPAERPVYETFEFGRMILSSIDSYLAQSGYLSPSGGEGKTATCAGCTPGAACAADPPVAPGLKGAFPGLFEAEGQPPSDGGAERGQAYGFDPTTGQVRPLTDEELQRLGQPLDPTLFGKMTMPPLSEDEAPAPFLAFLVAGMIGAVADGFRPFTPPEWHTTLGPYLDRFRQASARIASARAMPILREKMRRMERINRERGEQERHEAMIRFVRASFDGKAAALEDLLQAAGIDTAYLAPELHTRLLNTIIASVEATATKHMEAERQAQKHGSSVMGAEGQNARVPFDDDLIPTSMPSPGATVGNARARATGVPSDEELANLSDDARRYIEAHIHGRPKDEVRDLRKRLTDDERYGCVRLLYPYPLDAFRVELTLFPSGTTPGGPLGSEPLASLPTLDAVRQYIARRYWIGQTMRVSWRILAHGRVLMSGPIELGAEPQGDAVIRQKLFGNLSETAQPLTVDDLFVALRIDPQQLSPEVATEACRRIAIAIGSPWTPPAEEGVADAKSDGKKPN